MDGHPDDYRLWGNRDYFRSSGTKWVKLWVSWTDLQQELGTAPKSIADSWRHLNRAPAGSAWLRRLDGQVKAAKDDGLGVIVSLFHSFPAWSNGATRPDRVSPDKPPEQRIPSDLSAGSPWAWFVAHLCARYRKGAERRSPGPEIASGESLDSAQSGNPDGGWVDVLEICNEPNLLFWPQEAAPRAVAEMLRTATRLSHALDGPAIAGPATSDFPDRNQENSRGLIAMGWQSFTAELLGRLRGFSPPVSVHWTQHNFNDIKRIEQPSRAERVAKLLYARGWVTQVQPLWLTEGGYNLRGERSRPAEEHQARLIEQSFLRMLRTGLVHLWTQHTITDKSDNEFRSGLRDDFVPGKGPGARRPAWRTWKELPGSDRV
jgi:hypothetical protein